MPELSGKTAAVWLEPEQAGLVREIVGELGLRVVGVGSPALGRAAELATDLSPLGRPAAALDDLRQALVGAEGELFILASTGEFGGSEAGHDHVAARAGEDAAALAARRQRGGVRGGAGACVVTFDPLPASLLDVVLPSPHGGATDAERAGVVLGQQSAVEPGGVSGGVAVGVEWAGFVPLFRMGQSMRQAVDVLAHAGSAHTVAVELFSGMGEGGLGARLLDGIDLVTHLLGEPDAVSASYVWPGRGRVVHPLPGDSLHGLRGGMTVNLRYSDGRTASLTCADGSVGGGAWSRRATVVCDGGRVRIGDAGFEWVPAGGSGVDRSVGWADEQAGVRASAVFVEAIARLAGPRAGGNSGWDVPVDWARVLSVAGAALLSARTGEAESPRMILRMARTV
ncbi:MAG: hypothetical protein IT438_00340 [Phycisphaerales bacterium]|nr:hypothetical protein [Phycisphaerales bacterium]